MIAGYFRRYGHNTPDRIGTGCMHDRYPRAASTISGPVRIRAQWPRCAAMRKQN
jgi:hypothetical protein